MENIEIRNSLIAERISAFMKNKKYAYPNWRKIDHNGYGEASDYPHGVGLTYDEIVSQCQSWVDSSYDCEIYESYSDYVESMIDKILYELDGYIEQHIKMQAYLSGDKTIEINDVIYTLQNEAHISDNGETYEAQALDPDGEQCQIYWDIICESENADEQCDWDHPASVSRNGRCVWTA